MELCDELTFRVGHIWPLAASLIMQNTHPAGGALGHILNALNLDRQLFSHYVLR